MTLIRGACRSAGDPQVLVNQALVNQALVNQVLVNQVLVNRQPGARPRGQHQGQRPFGITSFG